MPAMRDIYPVMVCAALAVSACRRPATANPPPWAEHPGIDVHPAAQSVDGVAPAALPRTSFRLDPRREMAAATAPPAEVVGGADEALYVEAARSGQAWAQAKLGVKYVQEGSDSGRFGEGLRLLNTAAERNEVEALMMLSALAAQGRGMEQSDKKAFDYMNRAAEQESPAAQYALANMLVAGRGMPRDREAALVWGRRAAAQGYAPAQFSVGRALISSVERERQNEAVDLLTKAADGGQVEAALLLATALGKGEYGLPKDEARAEALLLPWAEKGHAECQFVLAALYQHGETFAERRGEVEKWLKRAADQGHPKALEILSKSGSKPAP